MSRSVGNSNPSSSAMLISNSSGSKTTKPKIKVTIEVDGSVVGEH